MQRGDAVALPDEAHPAEFAGEAGHATDCLHYRKYGSADVMVGQTVVIDNNSPHDDNL
jgi:hypothetical protein